VFRDYNLAIILISAASVLWLRCSYPWL